MVDSLPLWDYITLNATGIGYVASQTIVVNASVSNANTSALSQILALNGVVNSTIVSVSSSPVDNTTTIVVSTYIETG